MAATEKADAELPLETIMYELLKQHKPTELFMAISKACVRKGSEALNDEDDLSIAREWLSRAARICEYTTFI